VKRRQNHRPAVGVLAAAACSVLVACGQKGPLTLPESAAEPVQSGAPASENAPPGGEQRDEED
jgi:predicted small lipoprotein YifL